MASAARRLLVQRTATGLHGPFARSRGRRSTCTQFSENGNDSTALSYGEQKRKSLIIEPRLAGHRAASAGAAVRARDVGIREQGRRAHGERHAGRRSTARTRCPASSRTTTTCAASIGGASGLRPRDRLHHRRRNGGQERRQRLRRSRSACACRCKRSARFDGARCGQRVPRASARRPVDRARAVPRRPLAVDEVRRASPCAPRSASRVARAKRVRLGRQQDARRPRATPARRRRAPG